MSTVDHPTMPMHKTMGSLGITAYDFVSTSPSKLKYSFGGKNNRFRKLHPGYHDKISYNMPNTISKRAAGFGIGERFPEKSRCKS